MFLMASIIFLTSFSGTYLYLYVSLSSTSIIAQGPVAIMSRCREAATMLLAISSVAASTKV